MAETHLPDAAILIQAARGEGPRALDRWAPAIDQLTDLAGAARFLGLKGPDSIRRRMTRTRADGTRKWPVPDQRFGRSPAWTYRTLVLHYAAAPGRGHPGAALGRTNAHKRRQPQD